MSFIYQLQKYGPKKFSTRIFGLLAEIENPALKNYFIRKFITKYNIDMNEAVLENPEDYKTFNEFFTRQLKDGKRNWASEPELPSPVDGFVSRIGEIETTTMIQAKGLEYCLNDLLADEDYAKQFNHGSFATLYLSPRDYHRVHMPLDAKLTSMTFVPGTLFSVNTETVNRQPGLFTQNERLICHFESSLGAFAMVLVGALNVGSMFTDWHDGPVKSNAMKTWQYSPPIEMKREQEMGGFLMGSTVIMVFSPGMVDWKADLQPEKEIKLGQGLGTVSKPESRA